MGAFSQGPQNPGTCAVNMVMPQKIQEFFLDQQRPAKYTLAGVTRDNTGAALGSCSVEVFETITSANPNEPKGRFVGSTVSDAAGSYSVDVYAAPNATFRLVAYKDGTPVRGTSDNTLTGTPG